MVIRPYICGLYSTVKIPWNVCSQSLWSPGPTTSLCDTLLSICTASKCMTALYSPCGDSWLHRFNSFWNNEKGDRQSDDLSKVSCPMGWIHVQHELLKHLRKRLQRSQKKRLHTSELSSSLNFKMEVVIWNHNPTEQVSLTACLSEVWIFTIT